MNRIFNLYTGLLLLLAMAVGCNEDPTLTVLRNVSFTETPISSTDQIVLHPDNTSDQALTLTWAPVDYFIAASVTYSVQFAAVGDTTNWGNAVTVLAGEDVLTKSFTQEELNTISQELEFEADVPSPLVIRVKSYVDRDAFSAPVVVQLTPYKLFTGFPSLWVPGEYQGWDPSTAPRIASSEDNGVYEGYINIPEGGESNQFKFTAQPAWEPMAYGDGGAGVLIEANFAGGNFVAPSAGYFYLTADLNEMTYTMTKTTWGILGDATPGGWDTDTQLTFDPVENVWKVTADLSNAGSFKFRANNAWVMDFGVDAEGNIQYANHPVFGYNPDLSNLTVAESGNYTITLDLSEPGVYNYSLVKN